MAITVGQDTYISLADARTYAALEMLDLPTDDVEAETILKRAAKALDRRFAGRYLGIKANANNPMQWPRLVGTHGDYHSEGEVYNQQTDSDGNPRDLSGYPVELGEAQVEIAALMINGQNPLEPSEVAITRKTSKVDVLTVDVQYATPSTPTSVFNTVFTILRPILTQKNGLKMTRGA